VGGGADREGVASAQPGRFDRPPDDPLLAAVGAERIDRRSLGQTVERVTFGLSDGRELAAVLKFGGFWRSSIERRLYETVLDPDVHGSPALLAAGEGWLLLEDLTAARSADVEDEGHVRTVYRRLADIHSTAPPAELLASAALSAPDLQPLAALVARAAHDPQAWEITPAVESLVAALSPWVPDARPALAETGPSVLLHGDYQRGNWLIEPSGTARVIDWELAAVGPGILDLYYLQLRAPGAGHAPAGQLAERAIGWYCQRLGELSGEAVDAEAMLARLPDAIAWGALAAARLRLEDYYADTPRSRSPRGELPRAAADLIRYASRVLTPAP
jgi:hypothetical protein